jgi:hypothetical protein
MIQSRAPLSDSRQASAIGPGDRGFGIFPLGHPGIYSEIPEGRSTSALWRERRRVAR